jgi:hypothetical protein
MVQHQPGMNILRSLLVLKAKRDTAGAIIKYKDRFADRGDAQVCYALLRMRPLSISCAEGFFVISCGNIDYVESGWRDD